MGTGKRGGEQYFAENPVSAHEDISFAFEFEGRTLQFVTDAGVFSKEHVDPGSQILCRALPGDLGSRVLDLGCGWGAMTLMMLAVRPGLQVTMADINERALALAGENVRRNGFAAETVRSDGFAGIAGTFDAIVTNPPIRAGKAVIYGMYEQARAHLVPGGALYLVVRKQQGAESTEKYLKTLYPRVERIAREKGYHVLKCTWEG